jgi:hypothetical protein
MVGRVTNVEMTFLQQWRVGVRLSKEGGRRQWCRFNALVLAQEGGGVTKYCWKIKWRQQAHQGSMGRQRDTVW